MGPFQYVALEALAKAGIAGGGAAAFALALHIFLVGPVSLVGLGFLWRSTVPVGEGVAAAELPAPGAATGAG